MHWYIIYNKSQRTLIDNEQYEGSTTSSLKIKSVTANTAAVYFCQPLDGRKGPEITVSISGECVMYIYTSCNVLRAYCIYL